MHGGRIVEAIRELMITASGIGKAGHMVFMVQRGVLSQVFLERMAIAIFM